MTTTATTVDIVEMTTKMRIKETDDERATLSKKISYVLRYGIGRSIELIADDDGYYKVPDILALQEIFNGVDEATFKENVNRSNEDKIRYDMKDIDGIAWIKAAGHRGPQQSKADKEAKAAAVTIHSKGRGISEDEFGAKWHLDSLARQKLHELPPSQRANAMAQFEPGQNVPYEDYSKVFVSFCKRFRAQQGKGNEEDEGNESPGNHGSTSPQTKPVLGAMPFCPGVPWYSILQKTSPMQWGYPSVPAWGQMQMPAPWSPGMNFTPAGQNQYQHGYNHNNQYNYGYNPKGKGKGKTVYNQQSNLNPNAGFARKPQGMNAAEAVVA